MDDEFDLSAIVSNAEKLAAEREARERGAQEAEQQAREEALVRARERRAEEEREILKKQQEQEELRRARIAAMSPLRRFIVKRKPYVLGVAGVLALALVAALAVGTARWNENARIAAVKASCDPSQLDSVSWPVRQEIALAWIACPSESAQIAAVAAINDGVPRSQAASLLQDAALSAWETVRVAAAASEQLPNELLLTLTADPAESVRATVAQSERLPVSAFEDLAVDSSAAVRQNIAANAETPSAILNQLAGDPSTEVLTSIMERPIHSTDLLLALSVDSRTFVCIELMARDLIRPANSEDQNVQIMMSNLARCREDSTRSQLVRLLRNWNLPAFQILASDSNEKIRRSVAASLYTPEEVLTRMVSDTDVGVRVALAANSRTPNDSLLQLATDAEDDVRRRVLRNPAFDVEILLRQADIRDLAVDPIVDYRLVAARSELTPSSVLLSMASQNETPEVLIAIATNSNSTQDVLSTLAFSTSRDVRKAVIARVEYSLESLSYEALLQLCKRKTEKSANIRFEAQRLMKRLYGVQGELACYS